MPSAAEFFQLQLSLGQPLSQTPFIDFRGGLIVMRKRENEEGKRTRKKKKKNKGKGKPNPIQLTLKGFKRNLGSGIEPRLVGAAAEETRGRTS